MYLICFTNGGPNNTYSWQINGRNLSESSHILDHTISLADEDGGLYSCTVTNPAGNNTAVIYIYTELTVFAPPVDTFSLVGGVASFTCRARGFHTPSYRWTRTGDTLPDSSNITSTLNGSTLTISPVMLEDHGEYSCTVSVSGEMVNYTAILTGESYCDCRHL